ncbi:F-box/WD repeat-containing protein 12 isoform X2 [Phycodurus eques]|uniref:F-box/WD repeat-containing protein 12 isoform X2 n=1 Tax=Phycodurus eques TaxID=693459 RepID=UPI002ACDD639|nr:F-box/WD repeat-containing protein 12 isoform X2 [Phycodurus eques]
MGPQHLIDDCLIHIFTFLTEEDLIRASGVCTVWHNAAETPCLWRRMCLQRWGFCSQAVLERPHVNHSWKTYFLRRSHLETKMKEGRTGGYTCTSLRGHAGRIVGLVYLQRSSPLGPDLRNTPTTVCSASTDGTVRAWNIQNGQLRWCSAKQSPLSSIVSDEQRDFVITADSAGLIKVWQGQTGQEVASNSAASTRCTLLQYNKDSDWFLSVGTGQGTLCTLAGTALTKKSSIMVCDSFHVNILLVSPDKKWIIAGSKDNVDLSPKVIYADSLTSPCEDEDPLCQLVPVTGCQAAVFLPTQSARLAMVHCKERTNNKALTVFNVSIKKSKYTSQIQVQQVESFPLTLNSTSSNILLEAKDSNSIVMAADHHLWVYSLKGTLLASFKEHTMPITSICVDSFRVVTASQDLSLHVLTWKHDRDRGLTLESRYQLLGGSHTMSRCVLTFRYLCTIKYRPEYVLALMLLLCSHTMSRCVLTFRYLCTIKYRPEYVLALMLLLCSVTFAFRGFSHISCDYCSIVGSVEGKDGKDILKAYTFTA